MMHSKGYGAPLKSFYNNRAHSRLRAFFGRDIAKMASKRRKDISAHIIHTSTAIHPSKQDTFT